MTESIAPNHAVRSMHDFERQAREATLIRKTERVVALAVVFVLIAALFGGIGAILLVSAVADEGDPERVTTFLMGLVALAGAALFLGAIVAAVLGRAKRWRRRRAAARMALAHGWHYNLETPPSWYGGVLFRTGVHGWVESSMHVHEPRVVEVANYVFQPQAGTTSGVRALEEIGFVQVPLERPLPHMYLQAQGRSRPRPYGFPFSGQQRMDLEGDFNRFFTLYVPAGYERDALYVFTPDLMALLVDEAAGCDVEIVDDHLFVYMPRGFDLTHPAALGMATRIAATLGSRTQRSAERYVDERSAHPAFVDDAGARLRPVSRGLLTLGPAVVVVAWVAVWGWTSGVFG